MTENMTPELTLNPTETDVAMPELTLEPNAPAQVEEKKIEPVALDDKLLTEHRRGGCGRFDVQFVQKYWDFTNNSRFVQWIFSVSACKMELEADAK